MVGQSASVGEGATIHSGTEIGQGVYIGEGATLAGCVVQDDAVVGMGSVVQEGAVVEKKAKVGSGSIVTKGTVVKTGQLWEGSPAVFVRQLNAGDYQEADVLIKKAYDLGSAHSQEHNKSQGGRQANEDYRQLDKTSALFSETPF